MRDYEEILKVLASDYNGVNNINAHYWVADYVHVEVNELTYRMLSALYKQIIRMEKCDSGIEVVFEMP